MKQMTKVLFIAASLILVVSFWSSQSVAEWQTNEDFPLVGDPNAKKGGEFTFSTLASYPSTFRIHGPGTNTSVHTLMSSLVYETLVGVHSNTLEIIPGLAEAWEIQEDNMTFLFRLNPKARWADGQPVTPEDVVFSWELVTDPDTQDPASADLYTRMFEKPEVVDERTVKFVAKTLHWRNFLFCGAGLEILPAHIFKGKEYLKDFNWDLPNGSGPYKLSEYKKGNNIIFTRREDYWAKDEYGNQGVYNFDRIKFVIIRDQNLNFEKFKKGELDYYYVNVSREWVEEMDFEKIQKGWIQKRKIYTFDPNGHYGLAINMRRAPFDDVRVRKALAHLYNRPAFMEKLFFNEYQNMNSYFPGSIYENPKNEEPGFDPEKAQALLEEAGWSERNNQGILVKDGQPFSFTLLYSQKSSERYLTIFQNDLKKAGIEVKLKLIDWTALIKLLEERNFSMFVMAWSGMTFPNPESNYHSKYASMKLTNNITGINIPRIDEILEAYPEMFDLEERIAALQELDGLIYNEHPYILNWYGPFKRIAYWNRFGMPESYFSKIDEIMFQSMLTLWWYDEEKEKALQEAIKNNTSLPVGETEVRYWLDN